MIQRILKRFGYYHVTHIDTVARTYIDIAYQEGYRDAQKDEIPEDFYANLAMYRASVKTREKKQRVKP